MVLSRTEKIPTLSNVAMMMDTPGSVELHSDKRIQI